jgi:TolA-binding protein
MQIMTHTILRTALVVGLAAGAAAPAFAANKEHQQMMADIRMLQEQSQQLQILIGQVGETLKAVNARLDDQTSATRKAFADQKLTIDTLSSDLRVVREKVDDNNVRISSLTQELDALRQGVSQMGAPRPTTTEPTDPSAASAPTTGAAPVPVPGPNVGMSPTQLYDAAYSDYTGGQWDLAIQGFESFIRAFPKSEKAPDAQVKIGDAYVFQNKYDKGLESYDTAIRTYPSGGAAIAQAYYKKGLALRHMGQTDKAREAFDVCVKKDPDGEQGSVAILCRQAITSRQN